MFNPDVVFLLAAFLDARGLCQFSLTCKALGGKQTAYSGLTLVEEAARRLFECAPDWERSYLPKHDEEGSIERYHHLLMLRSTLTFDQLVGKSIQYGNDQTIVQTIHGHRSWSLALCSNHVMRSGRHFALFTMRVGRGSMAGIGVVRPVQIDESDFVDDAEPPFDPGRMSEFREYLEGKRTDRWGDSKVHIVNNYGSGSWHVWTSGRQYSSRIAQIGLLLDLNEGTLSIHQNGRRMGVLKDNLSGEYCWYATVNCRASVSIQRGSASAD